MKQLTGRTAVITGGGSGIGRATAHRLASRGVHLALVDVRQPGMDETAALVAESGVRVSTHLADVSDWDQVSALPAEVLDRHGACHILINNAGVTSAGPFDRESMEDLRWIVGINMWGVVHGCRAFLPALKQQDEAHIVNLSSMVGLLGLPQNAAYAMTKGAVRAFTESLRSELVTTNIGVTTVLPGTHRTAITAGARGSQAGLLAQMGEHRLAARFMRSPDHVAQAIVSGIEHNRARKVVGPDARVLDVAARLAPGRSGLVGRALDRFAPG